MEEYFIPFYAPLSPAHGDKLLLDQKLNKNQDSAYFVPSATLHSQSVIRGLHSSKAYALDLYDLHCAKCTDSKTGVPRARCPNYARSMEDSAFYIGLQTTYWCAGKASRTGQRPSISSALGRIALQREAVWWDAPSSVQFWWWASPWP